MGTMYVCIDVFHNHAYSHYKLTYVHIKHTYTLCNNYS